MAADRMNCLMLIPIWDNFAEQHEASEWTQTALARQEVRPPCHGGSHLPSKA